MPRKPLSRRFHFRMTPPDYRRLEVMSDHADISTSEMLRRLIRNGYTFGVSPDNYKPAKDRGPTTEVTDGRSDA